MKFSSKLLDDRNYSTGTNGTATLTDSFLLGSRMLCVARTFLLHENVHATDRPTALGCKNTSFILF